MTNETTAFLQAGGAADVAIARDADRAVGELARMIAIDTSFPPGRGYPEFADLMEDLTRPLGFEHRRIEVPEGLWRVPEGPASGPRINLLATRPTGKPVCSLYFHVDTVPAAPGWRRDPFHLARDGERLYGLGTSDMKGTIAAVLLALRAAEGCGIELAYDPMLLFCTDEEGGLYPGVRYLAEQGMLEGSPPCRHHRTPAVPSQRSSASSVLTAAPAAGRSRPCSRSSSTGAIRRRSASRRRWPRSTRQ